MREAEQATTVHWIVAGRASVYRHTHREGVLALLDLEPGEVAGEIAFLERIPTRSTAPPFGRARAPWSHPRALRASAAIRLWRARKIRLVESFARIAAKRLTATSALTAEAMSTGLWRERRLALHLSSIIAVLALFVVLSNSLDFLRKLASTRMSDAAFLTGFYFAYDTALGVVFFWLIRTLQEPATALGLQITGWPRQVAAGLVWSVPALAGAAALRAWLHPDEQLLSIYALSGGRGFLSPGALAGLVAYVLYLCPVQEYVTHAPAFTAPIMNAFGARLSGVGAVVSTLVADSVRGDACRLRRRGRPDHHARRALLGDRVRAEPQRARGRGVAHGGRGRLILLVRADPLNLSKSPLTYASDDMSEARRRFLRCLESGLWRRRREPALRPVAGAHRGVSGRRDEPASRRLRHPPGHSGAPRGRRRAIPVVLCC